MVDAPRPGTGSSVPAGWYPDPKMAGTQRYWDGTRWTDHAAPVASARPAEQVNSTLETFGWLGAVFLTPVGFVIGIIIASKGGRAAGRGAAMIALAVAMTVAGLMIWQAQSEQDERELEEQLFQQY